MVAMKTLAILLEITGRWNRLRFTRSTTLVTYFAPALSHCGHRAYRSQLETRAGAHAVCVFGWM